MTSPNLELGREALAHHSIVAPRPDPTDLNNIQSVDTSKIQ